MFSSCQTTELLPGLMEMTWLVLGTQQLQTGKEPAREGWYE